MNHLIECKDLVLGYEDGVVLENVTFFLSRGDYLVVLGDNGAGKSTLLKAILGLLPPLSGVLDKSGVKIGYLPQRSDVLLSFPASVMEVVLSGKIRELGKKLFYTGKMKREAREILARFNLEDKMDEPFSSLSGGEKQRVLISRALLAGDDLLVLDEPMNSLDVKTRALLYQTLEDLKKEGLSIIMVTHDIHPALNDASHVLYVGKEVLFLPKDEFFRSEKGKEVLKEGGHR